MSSWKTRTRSEGGFTLLEVVVALAIVALTTVVLLERRVGIVDDVTRARQMRLAWVLASNKMAELELDKELWKGEGSSSSGDFSEIDAESKDGRGPYAEFTWEYRIERRDVPTNDPKNLDEKPKEIFHLALEIKGPVLEAPILLEAEFPVDPPPADALTPAGPSSGAPPSPGPTAPAPAPPPPSPFPQPGGPK